MFIAVFFLWMASLISCSDEDIQISSDQEIFFEVNYVNYAWGKQFKGLIIDKDGQVRTYTNPVKWNPTDAGTEVPLSQIQENISNTVLSSANVKSDLQNYTSKINSLTDSEYSKPISGGADRGITSFYAYRYDKEKRIYKPLLLSQTGDIETYNKDKSAVEITKWLTGVLAKVY